MGKKSSAGKNPANRNYKDTVFRMLFQDRRRLLALYNAVSGREYTDPGKLEIVTLENAVYMGMKNDLAFLIDLNLYLFEHQSTINKNMPLRFLQYVSAEYEKLVASKDIYREKLVQIPSPHFIVFYNGAALCPEQSELRLSDAFLTTETLPELELRVRVLNINDGYNESVKEQCRSLKEYMLYVTRVRNYAKSMPLEKAVDRAVEECIREDILREFLLQNRAEVKKMSIYEYDDEAVKQALREDAYEEGKTETLVTLVCRKMRLAQPLEKIAEDLVEEISVIEAIYRAAEEFAPEYDEKSVLEKLNGSLLQSAIYKEGGMPCE